MSTTVYGVEISSRTWPTDQHIDAALEAFEHGMEAVDSVAEGHYCHLVTSDGVREDGYWLGEGVPAPTYRDIGVLAVFTDRLRAEAEELRKWVAELEETLHLARLNGLADDEETS